MPDNNSGSNTSSSGSHQMTKADAARIQSSQAKGGGDMSSQGFAARAQSAADRNANASRGQQGNTGNTGNTGSSTN